LGQDAFGDFFDGDGEFGGFASDFGALVVLREAQREHLGFASLHAFGGGFEFGQHATLAQHEGEVLGFAAFEGDAVDGAGEIERDTVTVGGGAVFAGLVVGALFAQDVERLLDFGVGDGRVVTGDGERRQVRHGDFGVDLEGGRKGQRVIGDAFG